MLKPYLQQLVCLGWPRTHPPPPRWARLAALHRTTRAPWSLEHLEASGAELRLSNPRAIDHRFPVDLRWVRGPALPAAPPNLFHQWNPALAQLSSWIQTGPHVRCRSHRSYYQMTNLSRSLALNPRPTRSTCPPNWSPSTWGKLQGTTTFLRICLPASLWRLTSTSKDWMRIAGIYDHLHIFQRVVLRYTIDQFLTTLAWPMMSTHCRIIISTFIAGKSRPNHSNLTGRSKSQVSYVDKLLTHGRGDYSCAITTQLVEFLPDELVGLLLLIADLGDDSWYDRTNPGTDRQMLYITFNIYALSSLHILTACHVISSFIARRTWSRAHKCQSLSSDSFNRPCRH